MRAFRIEKDTQMHKVLCNVLKTCNSISKNKRSIEMFKHIYYDAERQTIFATNGYVLLTFQTDEIKERLGEDIGNGKISVCGDFAIFEEINDAFAFPKFDIQVLKQHKSITKLRTSFCLGMKPYCGQVLVQLALNDITLNPKAVKDIELIADYLEYVSLQKDRNHSVMFCGLDDRLKFVIMPCVWDRWSPFSDEKPQKD